MIKLYRSKDSGKISPNYITLVDTTILQTGNANTKKYNESSLDWEINKEVKWNHFLKTR